MTEQPVQETESKLEELEDSGEVTTAARTLTKNWQRAFYAVGVIAALFHIGVNTVDFMVMPAIWRNACHLGFMMVMAYMIYPWTRKKPKAGMGIDLFLIAGSVVVTLYILFFQQELHLERNSIPIMRDYVFGAIAVVLLIIATWRASGPIIPVLSILFLAYALFLGKFVPGVFHYRGVGLGRLIYRMYLTDEGVFGTICTISSTYVFLFILFGAFLLKSGAGDFIIKLAQALAGQADRRARPRSRSISSGIHGLGLGFGRGQHGLHRLHDHPPDEKRLGFRPATLPEGWRRPPPPGGRSCRRSWVPAPSSCPSGPAYPICT